jgi:endonuclease/exonuclease/phosphatase family metal-dependent hydrolase
MKVLTYNVHTGLLDDVTYDELKGLAQSETHGPPVIDFRQIPARRYEGLLHVLSDVDADLVVLQELSFWGRAVCERLSRDAAYQHSVLFESHETHHHLGIMSRSPLTNAKELKHLMPTAPQDWPVARSTWHGIGRVECDHVCVYAIHLCPRNPEGRVHELRTIQCDLVPGRPTILLGDFNCLRGNEYADKFDDETEHGRRHGEKFGPPGSRSAVDILVEEHGFRDALADEAASSWTVPTRAGETHIHDRAHIPTIDGKLKRIRIDYALVSGDLHASSWGVIRNDGTDMLSDHFPLAGIIEEMA